MTEALQQVLDQIKQLSPDQQDAIVTKPASQRFLEELAAEALGEEEPVWCP